VARFGPASSGLDRTAAVSFGPITIAHAADGCDIATFGNHLDPGVVILDGYLFERARLRRELALRPDAGDAEIASAAYQRHGTQLFELLDGSYLIAIWDPREQRLLLGHDHLGHHPVFYAQSEDTLLFSTNVLALARSGHVSPKPNRIALVMATLQLWPPAGETFFENIHRLRGGHYLELTTRSGTPRVHQHQYWSPWLDDEEPALSEKEALEQFEPMLVAAVARSMDLQPDGLMLSGGLDSVTIAALAAEHAHAQRSPLVCAMSGRRDTAESEEEPMQDAVTRALQMPHIIARESEWMRGRSTVELSLDAVADLPGPSRIYWVGAYMEFYRFTAAHGLRVLLTGSGGDNWVSVADAYAAHTIRTLQLGQLVRHLRSWTGTGGLSWKAAAHHLLWAGGLRILLDSYAAKFMPATKSRYHRRRAASSLPDWLCPDAALKEAVVETMLSQRPASLLSDGQIPRNFYRHGQRGIANPYFQYEFELGFHIESSCGLRLLSPYHDRRMVRFLNSIPPSLLLHGDQYKGLLRPVAARRLPTLGLESQRKVYAPGVLEAQHREFRAGLRKTWPGGAAFTRLGDSGVIDAARVRRTFSPRDDSRFVDMLTMYALLSGERWLAAQDTTATPRIPFHTQSPGAPVKGADPLD
jgi:asparagine synthase (glutamine-hydrolysing)